MTNDHEEHAFRRGAAHAITFVIELLRRGATIDDIIEFSDLLDSWRTKEFKEATLQDLAHSHLAFFHKKKT